MVTQHPLLRVPRRAPARLAATLVATSTALLFSATAEASPSVFSGVGGTNVSVTPGTANAAMNAFRAGIGGANNGSGPPQTVGFRAINWDGVPSADAEPFALPGNFYLDRGATLSTPGNSLRVSANETSSPPVFSDINSTYASDFATFSPTRIFSPLGSVLTDITFTTAGTSTPATVSGFGAIFVNSELSSTSSIQYFDPSGTSLGTFFVPAGSLKQYEFLGVLFSTERVARVEVRSGTGELSGATNDNPGGGVNVVALDDLSYAEPQALAGPTVTIISPSNSAIVGSSMLTVTGTASDLYGIKSLTVNGQAAMVASDGSWSAPVTLSYGPNTVTVVATNNGGATASAQETVTYTPPSPPPTVTPPRSNLFTTNRLTSRKGAGTAILVLPGSGVVSVRATARLGRKLSTVARAAKTVGAGGSLTLTFKLSKAALRALAKHSLTATITITFTPTGSNATSQTQRLSFRRIKQHH
jgi:hypothetical protein